jgi:hypothetical protein
MYGRFKALAMEAMGGSMMNLSIMISFEDIAHIGTSP